MTDKNMKDKKTRRNEKNHTMTTGSNTGSTDDATDDVSSNCGASEASSKSVLSSLDFEEEEVGSVGECNDPSDETKPPKHHEIPENPNNLYGLVFCWNVIFWAKTSVFGQKTVFLGHFRANTGGFRWF